MKIRLIGMEQQAGIHKGRSIGRFDKYDSAALHNAQARATLNFAD